VKSNWIDSVRRPSIGLLYISRVIMRMENFVEWWSAGEKHNRSLKVAVRGPVFGPPLYIHTYMIGRGNLSTRRNLALVPLCPPQIPHDLTVREPGPLRWEASKLTAWATAWPFWVLNEYFLTDPRIILFCLTELLYYVHKISNIGSREIFCFCITADKTFRNSNLLVWFQIPTTVPTKVAVSWDAASYNSVGGYKGFGRIFCLHLQNRLLLPRMRRQHHYAHVGMITMFQITSRNVQSDGTILFSWIVLSCRK
jgi:hypothetical protein